MQRLGLHVFIRVTKFQVSCVEFYILFYFIGFWFIRETVMIYSSVCRRFGNN